MYVVLQLSVWCVVMDRGDETGRVMIRLVQSRLAWAGLSLAIWQRFIWVKDTLYTLLFLQVCPKYLLLVPHQIYFIIVGEFSALILGRN